MTVPFYTDDWLTLYGGDCREVLASLPADSVDCVVTSPPYWGLRDYGTEGQLGLERTPEEYVANMVAVFAEVRRVLKPSGTCWLNLGDSYASSTKSDERTPAERSKSSTLGPKRNGLGGDNAAHKAVSFGTRRIDPGLKPKDLVGIPWRVAFALQADGWYLRSEVIWQKPNPMPESVTDRPTKSHEQVFLLAKGQWKSRVVELSDAGGKLSHLRDDFGPDGAYAWASVLGVRLASAILDSAKGEQDVSLPSLDAEIGVDGADTRDSEPVLSLPVEHRATELATRLLSADCSTEQFFSELYGLGITLADRHNLLIGGGPTKVALPPGVYAYGQTSIAIEHPGEIREFDFLHNRIIASAPSTCSYYFDADAVREPIDPKQREWREKYRDTISEWAERHENGVEATGSRPRHKGLAKQEYHTGGRNIRSVWNIATRPYPGAHFAVFPPELPERCIKAGSPANGVVLDPFGGSGTVGMVANRLSRRAILIDLNPEYLKQQMRRNSQVPLGLTEGDAA
jgi:DNA modification methylase